MGIKMFSARMYSCWSFCFGCCLKKKTYCIEGEFFDQMVYGEHDSARHYHYFVYRCLCRLTQRTARYFIREIYQASWTA